MPLALERTYDYDLVKTIITHPKLWPHLCDDGSPPPEQYYPPIGEHIYYVLLKNGDELLGLWMFHPENTITWQVHTALLPNAWGTTAHEAAKLMAEWIWQNTVCRRIVANVPEHNRLALHFARAAGMKAYGRNPKSILKGGELQDQICLGMSRPNGKGA